MATTDELQEKRDEADQEDQDKKARIDAAIEARKHAEDYNNDLEEANRAADEAEKAIDNNGDSQG